MARIVVMFSNSRRALHIPDMSSIRWLRISHALARLGHEVDIATGEFKWRWRQPAIPMGPRLRRVPLSRVGWSDYDVVKTSYHQGFRTLQRFGGGSHPFIITRLAAVVAPYDMEGIYFRGRRRRSMFATQRAIHRASRYMAVSSEPARALWTECFGPSEATLLVPGAADAELPPSGPNPYPAGRGGRCLFAGNVYDRTSQPRENQMLMDKLNALGAELTARDVRLYAIGVGDWRRADPRYVSYCGAVPYGASWDYLRHAHAGVILTEGPFHHNSESTKIYHYLRVGLPVVSEIGFPNDHVVRESGIGVVVENGRMDLMAKRVAAAVDAPWNREYAVRFIRERHTWDRRAEVYDQVIRQAFP